MIFLIRSYHRRRKYKKQSGQITVWLSLLFCVFLGLYLVCLQSVQKQSDRRRAEQAAELGMFSLFSEYEPHLFGAYDLLFIDTSFGSGVEKEDELCAHLWKFIEDNSNEPLTGICIHHLNRATDGHGAVFYRQAVEIMKEKTGAALAEDWFWKDGMQDELEKKSRRFQEDQKHYKGQIIAYEDEEEEISSEAYIWDDLTERFTFSMALPENTVLSGKKIRLSDAPSARALSEGAGNIKGDEGAFLEKQWFICYLCEYLDSAPQMLKQEPKSGYLDYELEYVLCGHDSDSRNLEAVVHRLLLMREGVNYAYLLAHPELSGQADALALLLVGITGNEALIEGVSHLIQLGWAYGESLAEVRQLLGGYELSVVKTSKDWQVPLSGLLGLLVNPGKYDVPASVKKGITYESCLRMFLSLQPWDTLAMRALDVIEGELQCIDGCEDIHLDHCVESLTAQIWMEDISMERTYGYAE